MNEFDISIIKRGLEEYCETTFGMCLSYMKNNNIDYKLTGNDKLTLLLKEVDSIKESINKSDNTTILNSYRTKLFDINKEIRNIIGG